MCRRPRGEIFVDVAPATVDEPTTTCSPAFYFHWQVQRGRPPTIYCSLSSVWWCWRAHQSVGELAVDFLFSQISRAWISFCSSTIFSARATFWGKKERDREKTFSLFWFGFFFFLHFRARPASPVDHFALQSSLLCKQSKEQIRWTRNRTDALVGYVRWRIFSFSF